MITWMYFLQSRDLQNLNSKPIGKERDLRGLRGLRRPKLRTWKFLLRGMTNPSKSAHLRHPKVFPLFAKADLVKPVAFQESSKGNILSEKAQGKLPKKASSSKQPPQTPPKDLALRRHSAKSGQSSKTSEFEASASSPSKKMPDNRAEGTIEPMKIKISNLEIPVKMEPVADDNSSEGDLWTRAVGSGETTAIDSGTAKDRPPLGRVTVPSGTLPVDIGTAVMDIQTTLRSDIERLRLEVVKQFVSFKAEMGKKWKDEVEYLRDENVALKKRLEDLKREMKNKEKGSW